MLVNYCQMTYSMRESKMGTAMPTLACTMYCGITIVPWGPMFVGFVNNSCPWIYIPMNRYTITCLIFIKIFPFTLSMKLRPHKAGKPWLPMNIDPLQYKWFLSILTDIWHHRQCTPVNPLYVLMDFLHLSHRPGQLPSTQWWFSVCKTETNQTQNSDFHPLRGGSIKLGTTTSPFLHVLSSLL